MNNDRMMYYILQAFIELKRVQKLNTQSVINYPNQSRQSTWFVSDSDKNQVKATQAKSNKHMSRNIHITRRKYGSTLFFEVIKGH
jgi:DNA polymerase III psi subunit